MLSSGSQTCEISGRRQMHYALRVQGHLDPTFQDRFGELRIEQQEAGTTLLEGALPDQAALHGVLLQIVRLGLTLLSLETSEASGDEEAADRS
jgi:hypothetical protein